LQAVISEALTTTCQRKSRHIR